MSDTIHFCCPICEEIAKEQRGLFKKLKDSFMGIKSFTPDIKMVRIKDSNKVKCSRCGNILELQPWYIEFLDLVKSLNRSTT